VREELSVYFEECQYYEMLEYSKALKYNFAHTYAFLFFLFHLESKSDFSSDGLHDGMDLNQHLKGDF